MSVIACVIPAFNEAPHLGGVLDAIPDEVSHILVVDDASTDGTASLVRGHPDPRVFLIEHENNQGVGGAMVSGYRRALELRADIVVKLDGDGQMDPREIPRLVEPLREQEADYTKGMRFRDRRVLRDMPLVRLCGNLGLSFLTKAASGYWSIFDPTNGFTAIEKTVLERLPLDSLDRGFFFETDMLAQLYLIDAVVADVPIEARYGAETSHLRPGRALLGFPFRLLGAFLRRLSLRYFVYDFSAVSAFLVAGTALFSFGLVFGATKWIAALLTQTSTPIGTVMLAALPTILGFQLLLQAAVLDIQNVPRRPLQR